MSFSDELKQASKPIIEEIYNDGFIQDLLKGKLSKQAVRQYLRADASYLKEFTNLYALLIPKAPTMKEVKFLVEQIEFMLDGEVGHLVEIITLNICIIMLIHTKMLHTL